VAARRLGHSKLDLACQLVGLIYQQHPDRRVHLACDAADAGKALRGLPQGVTVTTRCAPMAPSTSSPRRGGPGSGAGPVAKVRGCPS
jgi:hypothetical protein